MSTEVKVPVLPESVSDATIAAWHKKPGDAVKRDENLVDLETDKVVLEVPAPADGVLKEIRHDTGDTVNSQDVIAILEEGAVAEAPKATEEKKETKQPEPPAKAEVPAKAETPAAPPGPGTRDSGLGKAAAETLSPAARRVATEEKIDVSQVEGTGRGGQVTKEDLVNYAKDGQATKAPKPAPAPSPSHGSGVPSPGSRAEERVPMTRMRARIAERLMQSKNSTAMLTSSNEVNLAKVVAMRKQLGEAFQKTHGVKLGYMSFFVKATCEALKHYPVVNASVDGNDIIYHGYQDISIAVSTERGLVTPVLRDAQDMSFAQVELAIADFAKRAREGKLTL
ncbi:MAG TPA: 2-oxo acid dehydrogenase subunit E2, partial [Rhodanobacteraceae bacterium]|nr:2-oxo acid dehydrogenase subunit E2 [Rhodanobacteraceae bacterium]